MLSIIIPTLNEEDYLPLLLESIKSQFLPKRPGSVDNYEVIIADGGSEDRTVETARAYGCRITKGGFPSEGRNNGAKIAKGDLFLFLDADTQFPKGSLEKLLREFKKKKLDIATCCLRPFGESFFLNLLYDLFYNLPLLTLGRIFGMGTAFFLVKKDIHEKVGGFDEDIKLTEDSFYVRESLKWGKFGVLKSSKIYYSQRRYEKDGWVKTYLKVALAYFHTIFIGPIKTDIFRYRFNHYKTNPSQRGQVLLRDCCQKAGSCDNIGGCKEND